VYLPLRGQWVLDPTLSDRASDTGSGTLVEFSVDALIHPVDPNPETLVTVW
jgi:hypothetical protein